jgi:predicted Zn-dependent protease
LIEGEEYEHALLLVDRMRLLDEGEYRLYLDAGVLYMKTGRLKEAKAILEKYIQSTPNAVDRIDAQALLNELRDV